MRLQSILTWFYICFRGEAAAQDVQWPVSVGGDSEADGDPDLPAPGRPQMSRPNGILHFKSAPQWPLTCVIFRNAGRNKRGLICECEFGERRLESPQEIQSAPPQHTCSFLLYTEKLTRSCCFLDTWLWSATLRTDVQYLLKLPFYVTTETNITVFLKSSVFLWNLCQCHTLCLHVYIVWRWFYTDQELIIKPFFLTLCRLVFVNIAVHLYLQTRWLTAELCCF